MADSLMFSDRFLPNAGKYVANVLNGDSNGEEKDTAFGWKRGVRSKDRHELGLFQPNAVRARELREVEGGDAKL